MPPRRYAAGSAGLRHAEISRRRFHARDGKVNAGTTTGTSGHNASVAHLSQKRGRTWLAVFQHPTDELRFLPRQRAILRNRRCVCHVCHAERFRSAARGRRASHSAGFYRETAASVGSACD